MTCTILILYYSRFGSVRNMAEHIARGVESIAGCSAMLRTVPSLHASSDSKTSDIPQAGDLYASLDDLAQCDGLALGSPTRFGNMATPLKHFIDTTSQHWLSGSLIDKPAAVFTSVATSGHESTLLSMMLPLFHHGMILVGLPITELAKQEVMIGSTFYGATHFAGQQATPTLSQDEIKICQGLGKRLAKTAACLKNNRAKS